MGRHVRIRCPICGMLSWQSRLAKKWKFEVVIQHIKGKGRGHGFSNTYYQPETEEGTWILKAALIDKMKAVIKELEGELHDEWLEKWKDGEYDEARMISSIYHTEFSEIATGVKGLPSKPRISVFPMPARVDQEAPAEVVREVVTPGILSLFDFGTREEEDTAISTPSEPVFRRLGARGFFTGSQVSDGIATESSASEEEDEDEIASRSGVYEDD